ncbi:MAG TPA: hypothetical protein VMT52_14180, partial [Planctomycetota bacterium]|nr:hypothetical protein [Planctomycetota bacterium]
DVSTGLENNVRGDGGDGENEFLVCGPEDDLREGRSNYGAEDPTPEFPDPLFYFNVTDPAMKAQAAFRLEVTVFDDPARAGAGIYLQYTNSSSTGPSDIPNTFFPLGGPPTNVLAGSGEWVTLTWDIADAGFRSFQQGAADFRLGTTDGGRICIDLVELVFGDTGGDVLFHRGDADDNGDLQITDAVRILGFLFLGSPAPPCLEAADADDNGSLQLTDAVRILGFLFLGGPPPEPPGPPGEACGTDPEGSPDLGCDNYSSC